MQNKHLFSRQKATYYLTFTFLGKPEKEIAIKTASKVVFPKNLGKVLLRVEFGGHCVFEKVRKPFRQVDKALFNFS